MKRIINGRRYDTTAPQTKLMAAYDNQYPASDFRWFSERLYRTSSGRWFVAGEGGPMSRWARHQGDGTIGSEGIRPLTDEECMAWLEDADEHELLELHFGSEVDDA